MRGRQSNSDGNFLVESFLSLLKKYPLDVQKNIVESLSKQFNDEFLTPDNILLPASIFSLELGAFESICRYLREHLGLSPKEISIISKRSLSTVENSYKNSLKKQNSKFIFFETSYTIPISVICDLNFGIQESIVYYLHENYKLNFSQISEMLKRNYQTVRTAYLKYVEKRDMK